MMSQSAQRRTRSAGGIERQEVKTAEIEDTAQQQQKVHEDQEKEKMLKAVKKKQALGQEGEQTDGKKAQTNDEQQQKQEKPKKKAKKKAKQDEDEVKDEQQQAQRPKKKKKANKKADSDEDEVKQQQLDKLKKKKRSKPKKDCSEDQMKEEEDQSAQKKKQKPKKKKKKKLTSSQQEQQQEEDEQTPEKTKKIKKDKEDDKRRRGRRPAGPVKRKKTSIFQRQQIINKKYRVKKKSHYLNRQSERTWGPMRAGPYRDTKKMSKQEQRKIIEELYGDGPGQKKERQSEKSEKMEVQNKQEAQEADEQVDQTDENVKIEDGKSQASTKRKTRPKSKPKKKKESDESEQSEQEEVKPKKKKPKRKKDDDTTRDRTIAASSKVSKRTDDSAEVKLEGESVKTTVKKKKKKTAAEQPNTEKQAKIQHEDDDNQQSENTKRKKKVKKSQEEDDSQSDSDGQTSKRTKKDGTKKQNKKKAPSKPKIIKQEDQGFTKQQSQKIINLFAIDGGNYPQMMKQLPGIRLKRVRTHLRMLFHRALDIITYHVQFRVGRKIKEWQQDQKVEIVRELHRIRSSNRLLSESNVQFREKMMALMRSYNDQSQLDNISEADIEFLYKRLQAFVRGYNTINRSKRATAASITESKSKEREQRYKFSKEVTRKPIISGGHLLSKSVKSEFHEEAAPSEFDDKSKLIAPEKLVQDWNRQQQKTLCQLYVNNTDADESICEQLRQKYGPQAKWRDFQLLGRKIDQLIKYALIKLQNLTARPYSREERRTLMEKKRVKLYDKLRKELSEEPGLLEQFYKTKLKNTSMFTYDNQLFTKVERLEFKHRIFKNLSLLERQIFGHLQSYKFKTALVRILIEEFPPEDDVEEAVRQAKKFSRWSRAEEKKSNISSIKNVFCGEREDRDYTRQGEEDYAQEDSIMADIQKVEIIKRGNDGEAKYAESVYFEEDNKSIAKSKFFGRGQEHQPITIGLDDDEVEVSDFQQPESAELKIKSSVQMQVQEEEGQKGEEFTMLQRLYEKLSKDGK